MEDMINVLECLRKNNIPLALINYECMELKQNRDDILWTITIQQFRSKLIKFKTSPQR